MRPDDDVGYTVIGADAHCGPHCGEGTLMHPKHP